MKTKTAIFKCWSIFFKSVISFDILKMKGNYPVSILSFQMHDNKNISSFHIINIAFYKMQ